jgi:hypothetical protein
VAVRSSEMINKMFGFSAPKAEREIEARVKKRRFMSFSVLR